VLNHLIIAQVSDTHINRLAEPNKNTGANPRDQFLEVIRILAARPLDLLVLSGDLAALAGEIEAYIWLKQALNTFPYPYIVMPGNHDDTATMVSTFALPASDYQQGMLYFQRTVKGRRLLFLDTSSYQLPTVQLDWLRQQLVHDNEPVLLFIHHPPLLCGCRFMDSYYSLRNIDEVWPVLRELAPIQHIFCGHYHAAKTVMRDGKCVHVTPSTMMQIDPDTPHFAIAHTRPGWRIIEWHDSEVHTYVEFI